MSNIAQGLTIAEIKKWLLLEVIRADNSFQIAQMEACAAMARDLIPGQERIAVQHLKIDELTVKFCLRRERKIWLVRLWGWLRRVMCKELPASEDIRFLFTEWGRGDVMIQCRLSREKSGLITAVVNMNEGVSEIDSEEEK